MQRYKQYRRLSRYKRYLTSDVERARDVPITEWLQKAGFDTRHKGKLYYSPFRDERTPSFAIDATKNLWYDHGGGIGGDIIKLVMRLKSLSFAEAVVDLAGGEYTYSGVVYKHEKAEAELHHRKNFGVKDITDDRLVRYAAERGISEPILRRYCRQAEYTYTYHFRGEEMTGHASMIAFRNDSGGYELRDRRFKAGEGHKDISVIAEDDARNATYVVFEGFFNLLSYAEIMALKGKTMPNVIVLNSVSIWQRAANYLRRHNITGRIMLCLDNDAAGEEATKRLIRALGNAIDVRKQTLGEYNDLNDRLTGKLPSPKAPATRIDASPSAAGTVVHADDKHAAEAKQTASAAKDTMPIPSAAGTEENMPDEHDIYMHVASLGKYSITAYHDRVEAWLAGRGWMLFRTVIPFAYHRQLANKIVALSSQNISNGKLADKINDYIHTNSVEWAKNRLTSSRMKESST